MSIVFFDKHAKEQYIIELDNNERFMVMINMYKEEKEVIMDTMEGLANILHIKSLMKHPLARIKNIKDHEFLL